MKTDGLTPMIPLVYHPPLQHHGVRAGAAAPVRRPEVPPHPRRPGRPWPAPAQGLRAASPGPPPGPPEAPHARNTSGRYGARTCWPASWRCRSSAGCPAGLIDWRILRPMRYATGGRSWPAGWPWSTDSPSTSAAATTMRRPAGAAASASMPTCRWRQGPPRRGPGREGAGRGPRRPPGQRHRRRFPGLALGLDLDLYEEDIFPTRKEPEDYPLPVRAGMTGVEYLGIVAGHVPEALDAVRPDLVIYNAGSDPFVGDPLARLRLTRNDLVERDCSWSAWSGSGASRWRWSSRAGIPPSRGASTPTPSRAS